MPKHPPSLAPDGYRYGVMFSDGSVANRWNGRTQRKRAEEHWRYCTERWPRDNITLARCAPGEPWERIEENA